MPSANHGAAGRRASLATAIALSIFSIPAHAVIVDGDVSDLATAVGASVWNTAQGTDANNDAGGLGFDITSMYAFYDWPADILYLGMSFNDQVGRALNTEAFFAPVTGCMSGGAQTYVFDCSEQYGFRLHLGDSPTDTVRYTVKGNNTANSGLNSETLLGTNFISAGLTVSHAVSETDDDVEFSISGLYASGIISAFPQGLTIDFRAGAAEATQWGEDSAMLSIQAVPVPAAAWLFGSGLVGLIAASKKQRKTA